MDEIFSTKRSQSTMLPLLKTTSAANTPKAQTQQDVTEVLASFPRALIFRYSPHSAPEPVENQTRHLTKTFYRTTCFQPLFGLPKQVCLNNIENLTMYPRSFFLMVSLAFLWTPKSQAQLTVVDFESLPVPASHFFNGDTNASSPYRDNFTITGTRDNFGETEFLQLWKSNDVEFFNGYTPGFGSWNGFSWSKVADTTTPGFANQYAAFSGGGSDGAGGTVAETNYAVGFGNQSFLNLPDAAELNSIDITNTTYAGISMRDGDSFAKKFGGVSGNDKDFLKLTLTGFEDVNLNGGSTGAVDVFLADYRFSDNSEDYILDSWNQFDLTDLGSARSIGFSFTSTDNGDFGANTPLFVAIDNLSYSIHSVPEPATPLVLSLWAFALITRRSRKPHHPTPN